MVDKIIKPIEIEKPIDIPPIDITPIEEETEITTITPEFDLQGKELAVLKDGRKIIHALLSGQVMNQFKACCTTEMEKTKEGFDDIGVSQFIGYTREDVTKAFPELAGTKVIGQDEKGNDILAPKLMEHSWAGDNETGYFVVGGDEHEGFKTKVMSTKEVYVSTLKENKFLSVDKWVANLVTEKRSRRTEIS